MNKSRIVLVESEMGTFFPTLFSPPSPAPLPAPWQGFLRAFKQLTETQRGCPGLGRGQQETDVFVPNVVWGKPDCLGLRFCDLLFLDFVVFSVVSRAQKILGST